MSFNTNKLKKKNKTKYCPQSVTVIFSAKYFRFYVQKVNYAHIQQPPLLLTSHSKTLNSCSFWVLNLPEREWVSKTVFFWH